MQTSPPSPWRIGPLLLVLAAGLTVRAIYILLFPHCYSFDLKSWNTVGDLLVSGDNPYHKTALLNWPPFWMQCLYCFKLLAVSLHLPFELVVRGFLILVELALEILLYATARRFTPAGSPLRLLLLGLVLNPIPLLQVCQHCNFDVLVGFWVLLAVWMLLRFQEKQEAQYWLFACFALGMGVLTKTVPLCLAPLLMLSTRKLRPLEIALGTILLLGPVCLGLSIVYVLGPQDIQQNVLAYRSTPGSFGPTGLLLMFGGPELLKLWQHLSVIAGALGWISLGIWLFFLQTLSPRRIVTTAAVLLLAIPTMGSGFGAQYVYWFLPLLVLAYSWTSGKTRLLFLLYYFVAAGTYLFQYGLISNIYGAYLLELWPDETLLKLGLALSLPANQTLITLPLWLLSVGAVVSLLWQVALPDAALPHSESSLRAGPGRSI
jgi:hypothetical protein